MADDHDLRAVDGSLWRLRRRDAESDADYAARRQERARQAATLRTYPLSWADFEMISPPTPNGHLVSQIDDLAAIARSITDDETLQAVVTSWREILSAVPLPSEGWGDHLLSLGEHAEGLDMMRRRAAGADPEKAMELLKQFGTEPPQPGDEMPPDVADAIEREVTLSLDVGDLTREELELIADSEIPEDLRWNSDETMPAHMIELFENLADTPYDIAAVDAAAEVYAAAAKASGGQYGHALAAVWRAWHRDEEK